MPAPRRNHYVPRFLLKRFSSRSQGKKSWIWQVSHEDDPVEISTRDAAVTRDFYGGPSSGVEDAFATAETRFADVLAAIESGDSPQLHQKELREFIWTLVVRTRAFRQQFAQFSDDLLEKVLESAAFAPGDDRLTQQLTARLSVAFEEHVSELPPAEQAQVKSGLALLGLEDDPKGVAAGVLGSPLAQRFCEQVFNAAEPRGMEKAAARGQIEGLKETLAPSSVPESFSPHSWTVHRVKGRLILGDGCVFVRTRSGRVSSLILAKQDWEYVYLPVSPSSILVGSRTDGRAPVDAEELNDYSAGLSWTHFFSSTMDASTRARARSIRGLASQSVERELSALVSDV